MSEQSRSTDAQIDGHSIPSRTSLSEGFLEPSYNPAVSESGELDALDPLSPIKDPIHTEGSLCGVLLPASIQDLGFAVKSRVRGIHLVCPQTYIASTHSLVDSIDENISQREGMLNFRKGELRKTRESAPIPIRYHHRHILPKQCSPIPQEARTKSRQDPAIDDTAAVKPASTKGLDSKRTIKSTTRTPLPSFRVPFSAQVSQLESTVSFCAVLSEMGVLRTSNGISKHYDALGIEIPMPAEIEKFRAVEIATKTRERKRFKMESRSAAEIVENKENDDEVIASAQQIRQSMTKPKKAGKNAGRLPRRGAGVGFKSKVKLLDPDCGTIPLKVKEDGTNMDNF